MNKKDRIYEDAIILWGKDSQIGMFHEEIGEVLQAINKFKRNSTNTNINHIVDELADLSIMLDQMVCLFDINDIFNERKTYKLNKLFDLINKKYIKSLP